MHIFSGGVRQVLPKNFIAIGDGFEPITMRPDHILLSDHRRIDCRHRRKIVRGGCVTDEVRMFRGKTVFENVEFVDVLLEMVH